MSRNTNLFEIAGIYYRWDYDVAKRIINDHVKTNNITKEAVYRELAAICQLTDGAVKNWFTRKNGPDNFKMIEQMAVYFRKKPTELLKANKTEVIIKTIIEETPMSFDFRTVKFVEMLNELARLSMCGYKPFSELHYGDRREGLYYIDEEGPDHGKIVLDMCVDEIHHDMISDYDDLVQGVEYSVLIVEDEEGKHIEIEAEEDITFVVENGEWYSFEN